MSDFVVGEIVEWSSQSAGITKHKCGVVREVVLAGKRPNQTLFPTLYRPQYTLLPRNHTSYVVAVGSKIYWPRTIHLRRVAP